MKYKLLAILILFSTVSFGQSINTQYVNGKKRVSDSIGFYPTYVGHTIDKITTAGCWWNVFDFAKNIWDTTRINFVRKSDSTLYVTQKKLNDTAAAIRASITGGGGGSTDTTSLSNRINAKIDTANRVQNLNSPNRNDVISTAGLNAELGLYPTTATMHTAIHDSLNNLSGGTGISIATNSHIVTNTAPDQTVTLNNGTGISISGTYPTFTVTNTSPSSGGTVTTVTVTPVNGVSGTVANSTTTPAITLSVDTIQSGTELAGTIHAIAIPDPATPQPNTGLVYMDATHHVLNIKNDAGVVSNTAIPNAGGTNLFFKSFAADGTFTTGTPVTDSTVYASVYRNDTGNRNLRNQIAAIPATDSTVFQTKYRSDTGRTNTYAYINTKGQVNSIVAGTNMLVSGTTTVTVTPDTSAGKLATQTDLLMFTPQENTVASYTTSVVMTSTIASAASNVTYTMTAQASALLFAAPTGSWAQGQILIIDLTSDATPRALTYNAAFRSGSPTPPTTTTASKKMVMQWRCSQAGGQHFDFMGYSDGLTP